MKDKIIGGMMGFFIGDALGVPVEFKSRKVLEENPVTDMNLEYGTHHQPLGTWSDDTSLTLCLMDSLKRGLDYDDMMKKFLSWVNESKYTAHGEVFDIGIATKKAISNYSLGIDALACGGKGELDNGNGSLMRILPLAFYIYEKYGSEVELNDEVMTVIHNVSSLTHAHARSLIACGIYISIALLLLNDLALSLAIAQGVERAFDYYEYHPTFFQELTHYAKLKELDKFSKMPVDQISSSGYVVHTLEAGIWCLLTTKNYQEVVLKAVNLGDDTDTIAAVAGGLACMYYGYEEIPKEWLKVIVKRSFLEESCNSFYDALIRKQHVKSGFFEKFFGKI